MLIVNFVAYLPHLSISGLNEFNFDFLDLSFQQLISLLSYLLPKNDHVPVTLLLHLG